jgi:hypothetical protein
MAGWDWNLHANKWLFHCHDTSVLASIVSLSRLHHHHHRMSSMQLAADMSRSKQVRFLVPLTPPPEDTMHQREPTSLRERIVTTQDQPTEKLRCGPGSSWDKEHLLDLDVEFHPRRVVSFDNILQFPPEEWAQEIRDRMPCLAVRAYVSHCPWKGTAWLDRHDSSTVSRQLQIGNHKKRPQLSNHIHPLIRHHEYYRRI